MLTPPFLHPALLHGPHVHFRKDGDPMGPGRPHGQNPVSISHEQRCLASLCFLHYVT